MEDILKNKLKDDETLLCTASPKLTRWKSWLTST